MYEPFISPYNTALPAKDSLPVVVDLPEAVVQSLSSVSKPIFNKDEWLRALHKDKGLSPAAKHRALALTWLTDAFGFGHPNHEHIEEILGNKSVKRSGQYIKNLRVCGWIDVETQKLGPNKTSNNYQLRYPEGYIRNLPMR